MFEQPAQVLYSWLEGVNTGELAFMRQVMKTWQYGEVLYDTSG